MIEPTVGRVVWYYPPGHKSSEQPWPAIISHVHHNRCVNLAVFSKDGKPMIDPPQAVELLQDEDDAPCEGNYCAWMPFQKGQAAKTEELGAKLEACYEADEEASSKKKRKKE